MTRNGRTAIFVHIPRTAGTTLHRIIERHYPARRLYSLGPVAQADIQRFNAMEPAKRRQYRMIKGHLPFGKPENVEGPVAWMTLLRAPLERAVSFFRYVRGHPSHYLNTAVDRNMDLATFVSSRKPRMMDNAQTRMLSGAWLDPPFGACTGELLAKAKDNLEERFDVVGLTEHFDESLLLLRRCFGWRWLNYRRLNTSPDRTPVDRLSDTEREVLEENNALDCELYRFAEGLFKRRIAGYGPDFEADLAAFQAGNRPYPALWEIYWRVRSRSPKAIAQAVAKRVGQAVSR
jgi:hypothetical protein